jgi:hypothetical protein
MARELFAAGFVSCWAELEEPMREALVRSLEAALASPSIPAEIVTTLLNLAEFMEHNEKKLPLDTRQVLLLSGQSALCWGWCTSVAGILHTHVGDGAHPCWGWCTFVLEMVHVCLGDVVCSCWGWSTSVLGMVQICVLLPLRLVTMLFDLAKVWWCSPKKPCA